MRILYALSICILAIYVFVIAYSIYHRPRPVICICNTLSVRPTIYGLPPGLNDYMLRHHNSNLSGVYMEILEIDCMTARGRIVNNSDYTIIWGSEHSIDYYCELERQWRFIPKERAFTGAMFITHPGEYFSFATRVREVNDMQYSGLFRIVRTVYRDVNPYDDTRPRWVDSERHSIAAMFAW